MQHREIECRFLEIDKDALVKTLRDLDAHDRGEVLLQEAVIYDPELKWKDEQRFVRLRKTGDTVLLSYKEHQEHTVDGTFEVETTIGDFEKAVLLFEKIGLPPYRRQEKKRHTFELDGVIFDIDTWPKIPTYVELEGESEQALRDAAQKVGLDWNNAVFHNAAWVIENKYGIPVRGLRWFMFDRVE